MRSAVPAPRQAETDATEAHHVLFTSGQYVHAFQPEAEWNPFRSLYARKRAAILAGIPGTGLRILDIGAGPGRMAIPLSLRHSVTMCDLSMGMLDRARPGVGVPLDPDGGAPGGAGVAGVAPSLQLCAADAAHPPFRPGSFDRILCIDVMPHLADPVATLRSLRCLLRPGGRLIVDSTNSLPLWTLAYPRYLGRRPGRWVRTWRAGGVSPEWSNRVRHHRRADFLRILDEAGLTVFELQRFGPAGTAKWHLAVTGSQ